MLYTWSFRELWSWLYVTTIQLLMLCSEQYQRFNVIGSNHRNICFHSSQFKNLLSMDSAAASLCYFFKNFPTQIPIARKRPVTTTFYYRPPMKLEEGNVFIRVCQPFCRGVGISGPMFSPQLGISGTRSLLGMGMSTGWVLTPRHGTGIQLDTVGKLAVRMLLEYFLVLLDIGTNFNSLKFNSVVKKAVLIVQAYLILQQYKPPTFQ